MLLILTCCSHQSVDFSFNRITKLEYWHQTNFLDNPVFHRFGIISCFHANILQLIWKFFAKLTEPITLTFYDTLPLPLKLEQTQLIQSLHHSLRSQSLAMAGILNWKSFWKMLNLCKINGYYTIYPPQALYQSVGNLTISIFWQSLRSHCQGKAMFFAGYRPVKLNGIISLIQHWRPLLPATP